MSPQPGLHVPTLEGYVGAWEWLRHMRRVGAQIPDEYPEASASFDDGLIIVACALYHAQHGDWPDTADLQTLLDEDEG